MSEKLIRHSWLCEHFGGYKTINRIPLHLHSLRQLFNPFYMLVLSKFLIIYHIIFNSKKYKSKGVEINSCRSEK